MTCFPTRWLERRMEMTQTTVEQRRVGMHGGLPLGSRKHLGYQELQVDVGQE